MLSRAVAADLSMGNERACGDLCPRSVPSNEIGEVLPRGRLGAGIDLHIGGM